MSDFSFIDPKNPLGLPTEPKMGLFGSAPTVAPPPQAQPGSAVDQYYARMLQMMPTSRQQGLGDLSSLLGSFSSGEKANRVVQGNFQGDYDRNMLDREANKNRLGLEAQTDFDRTSLLGLADQRDSEKDALRKLQQGEYLKGGGAHYAPPSYQLGGKQVTAPSFSFAPKGATAAEQQAGGELSVKMADRLNAPAFQPTKYNPTWDYTPMDPSQYAKPGMLEKIGSYGALGTGALGIIDKLFGGGAGGGGGAMDERGGMLGSAGAGLSRLFGGGGTGGVSNVLGKLAGPAGAAAGTYGLLTQGGLGHNLANGATAGAGIGTMFAPGIGTAIGAGIGAGVGGIKSLIGKIGGGPSEQEQQGRASAGQAIQGLTAGATPQQLAEAQSAGWQQPQEALMNIILRDKLAASGKDPALASQFYTQLMQAERQGPQAVQSVIQNIMKQVV